MTRMPSRRFRCAAAALFAALLGMGVGPNAAAPTRAGDIPADSAAEAPAIAWLNYREAKAASRHQERPLLMYFAAAWNTSSLRLDRETWTDRRVRSYLEEHLVTARVDMQDMPAVAEHFDVKQPPAILFLAPDGRRLVVLRGYHGPESILRVATYIGSRAYEYAEYETWLSRNPGR